MEPPLPINELQPHNAPTPKASPSPSKLRRHYPLHSLATHPDMPTDLATCNVRKACDATEASAEPFRLNTTAEAPQMPQSPTTRSIPRVRWSAPPLAIDGKKAH